MQIESNNQRTMTKAFKKAISPRSPLLRSFANDNLPHVLDGAR